MKQLNNPLAGYDARSGTLQQDLISIGLVDPTKVVKSSLRYGVGLASIMLTADCAVVDEEYNFM